MIRIKNIIEKEISILFYGTPLIYAVSKLIGNQSLYAIKDIWMAFICLQIFIYFLLRRLHFIARNLLFVIIYFSYVIINSIIQMEDVYFFLVSLREMVATPLMLIIIGMFLDYVKKDYLNHMRKALYYTCILTVLFSIIFPNLSFGPTNRLCSFWDREHEPSIIGGMFIVSSIAASKKLKDNVKLKSLILPLVFGVYCIVLSRSRSAFIAVFFSIIYIYADRISGKNLVALVILGILGYLVVQNYSVITHRELTYNVGARLSQYSLAYDLIKTHPIFGIGVDKYGVLGSTVKVFTYKGFSTSTMDSDIIKYIVNLGFIYGILLFTILLKTYKVFNRIDRNGFVFIIFGLAIGAVTGKLGSYPLNHYFYPIIGYIILSRNMYGESKKESLVF